MFRYFLMLILTRLSDYILTGMIYFENFQIHAMTLETKSTDQLTKNIFVRNSCSIQFNADASIFNCSTHGQIKK